jgi:hypothetical protein
VPNAQPERKRLCLYVRIIQSIIPSLMTFSLRMSARRKKGLTLPFCRRSLGLIWIEAAHLSGLSKEAAIKALAAAIQSLPDGDWMASDTQSIAARLIAFLPEHDLSTTTPSPDINTRAKEPMREGKKKVIWMAVGLGLMVTIFLSRLLGE